MKGLYLRTPPVYGHSYFAIAQTIAHTHSPEATFAKCGTFSSSLAKLSKKWFAPFAIQFYHSSVSKLPLSDRIVLQIDKSIFFLKIMLAFLQMCIFCCTFAASFDKRTQKQINLIKNKKLMKKINFWVATLFMALLPVLFTSCNQQNGADDITVVGKWEVKEAIRAYYFVNDKESLSESESYEVGQVWEFTKDRKLMVSDIADTFTYTVSNNVLTTNYATTHYSELAKFFLIENLTAEQLVLSVHYREKDKVGERDVTNTLTFSRLVE